MQKLPVGTQQKGADDVTGYQELCTIKAHV